MRGLRIWLDAAFENLGSRIARRAWWVIAAAAVLVGSLGSQLPALDFDTSIDGHLKPGDSLRVNYETFRKEFGRDERIFVALRPRNGTIFEPELLKTLKAIHRDIEDHLPRLEEVTSLVNARNTYAQGDTLIVDDLLFELPDTPEDLARFREQARTDPVYQDLWISDDATEISLAIETDAFDLGVVLPDSSDPTRAESSEDDLAAGFDAGGFDAGGFDTPRSAGAPGPSEWKPLRSEDNAEIVAAVERLVDKYRSPDLEIRIGGSPTMTARLLLGMKNDLGTCVAWSLVMIASLLALVFRRATGVVLPLLVVISTVICMLGFMALTGTAVAFGTQILPSAMLAVGVGYSVHLLTIFFRRYDRSGDKHASIARALGHSGLAITLSALTTAVGFGSFVTSDVLPLYQMGLVGPVGIALAWLLTITALPAALAVLPLRRRERGGRVEAPAPRTPPGLFRIGVFAHRRARSVVVATGLLAVAAIAAASQLQFTHDPMTWLPLQDSVRVNHDYLDEKFDGTMVMEMVLDFHEENALHDPEILARIEQLTDHAQTAGTVVVGKTLSIVDVIKEIHKALHEDDPAYYAIPDDQWTTGQEFLLFENSGTDDLEKVTNSLFSKARITFKVEWMDTVYYPEFIRQIETYTQDLFGPDVDVYLTGTLPVMSQTMTNIMYSAVDAYVLAFLLITPLIAGVAGRLRIGLASIAPNLLPIAGTLAVMYVLGVGLDMFTILVGSIAMGLVVDDTIHFVHTFSRSYEKTGDAARAIRITMQTAGRAMLFTTLVLCCGFSVFAMSELNNLLQFGTLTALAVALAFLFDILLAPALLTLVSGGSTAPAAQPAPEVAEAGDADWAS